MARRVAAKQFALQVTPLVVQLSLRYADFFAGARCIEFSDIEAVAASFRLPMHFQQIGIDGGLRIPLGFEAFQLWMIFVAARLARQNGFG